MDPPTFELQQHVLFVIHDAAAAEDFSKAAVAACQMAHELSRHNCKPTMCKPYMIPPAVASNPPTKGLPARCLRLI